MNYAKIIKYDTANWDGINTTVFFSGCTLKCQGCFNKDIQDFKYGHKFTFRTLDLLVSDAFDDHVDGICILGGEPFDQDLNMLLRIVMELYYKVSKPIHIWSGYRLEKLLQDPMKTAVLEYCDTLVDGPFIESEKDLSLKYRGSSNQRVIDVKKSLSQGEVVLYG